MQTHLRAAIASPKPPEPGAGLIDSLGAIEDEDHILVIGQDGPDLMCRLIRAGATQVTHLCSHERPEAESASLAIVPLVPSLDWLAAALPSIRRALIVNGRLVIAIGTEIATHPVRRLLASHGFTAVRIRHAVGRQVFSAELPAFGLLRCA